MFQAYLDVINQMSSKNKNYANNLINHINNSLDRNLPLYAVHSHCTDGGTAGAMIRYAIPEAAIIPLDYWILKDKIVRPILKQLDWVGIVDLEPFNSNQVDFWVDHHLSSLGKSIKAKKIRFDVDGDSGSWQLLLSSFIGEMPDHLVELAVMTRTTDTAAYITSPPTQLIEDLTDLNITIFEGEEGKKQEEQRIWLLNDAWGSAFSLKEHFQLFNYLAKDGFYGLSKVLNRVNEHRKKRITAIEIANEIKINSDVIIFSFNDDSVDKFTIINRLQENGAKVVISLSKSISGVRISLRRNRKLPENEAKNILLNELAVLMNGGGHAGASGGHTNSIEEAQKIINNWSKEKNLSIQSHEIN